MTTPIPVTSLGESDQQIYAEAVPVRIVPDPDQTDENSAPDFTYLNTMQLTGLEDAQQAVPQANKRVSAQINVIPGAVGNTAGYVLVGSQRQVVNGVGMRLPNGGSVSISGKGEIWVRGDRVNSLWVNVKDERER